MDPGDEIVDLIDGNDRVIGTAFRREVRAKNLFHRGAGILVRNSRGEIYVHRRTETKDVFPGRYDMLVGGMVASGESYEIAARRELGEELGIREAELSPLFVHLYDGPHNHVRVTVFETTWDGPIRHQESEIAWGRWMSLDEILERIPEWDWVPDGLEIFERWRATGEPRSGR